MKTRIATLFFVFVIGGSLVAVPEASAAIPERVIECGETITESTKITNEVPLACTGDGVVVGADSIQIFLPPIAISGDGGAGDYGIDNAAGHTGVLISGKKGKSIVSGFEVGLFIEGESATTNEVSGVTFRQNEIGVRLADADHNRFESNVFDANSLAAMELELASNDNKVEKNEFKNNGSGINVDGSSYNQLTANIMSTNGVVSIGIIDGVYNKLSRNKISFGSRAVELTRSDFNRLESNVAEDVTGGCVRIWDSSDYNQLYKNKFERCAGDGISISNGNLNLLHKNKLIANHANGILLGAGSSATDVAGNSAYDNGLSGKTDIGDDVGLGIDGALDVAVSSADNKAKRNDNPLECSANIVCKT